MAFCSNCGVDAGSASFCTSCGKAVLSSPAESATFQTTPFQEAPSSPAKRIPTKILIPVGVAAAVLAVGVVIFSSSLPTPLETAYQDCGGEYLAGITIADDGKSMLLDMQGEEDLFGADYSDISCVLNALEVPEIVSSQISITTSLMGVQTADWSGITASWTYHPDLGLDMTLKMN